MDIFSDWPISVHSLIGVLPVHSVLSPIGPFKSEDLGKTQRLGVVWEKLARSSKYIKPKNQDSHKKS